MGWPPVLSTLDMAYQDHCIFLEIHFTVLDRALVTSAVWPFQTPPVLLEGNEKERRNVFHLWRYKTSDKCNNINITESETTASTQFWIIPSSTTRSVPEIMSSEFIYLFLSVINCQKINILQNTILHQKQFPKHDFSSIIE